MLVVVAYFLLDDMYVYSLLSSKDICRDTFISTTPTNSLPPTPSGVLSPCYVRNLVNNKHPKGYSINTRIDQFFSWTPLDIGFYSANCHAFS